MSFSRVQILSCTKDEINVVGERQRAAISGREISGLYTVAVSAQNFRGRLYIEGSIAADPTDEDWFAIPLPGVATPYVEFPIQYDDRGWTTLGYSFKANLNWIRARVDRDYLRLENLTKQELSLHGQIDKVVLIMVGF